ncbi:hypothetical protein [Aliarcobacter cibarius]|uniref:Lipoprotein n=1 Tax=Aliarcobacter cibarius TaxID=255507 RepID=A0ABY2V6H7_9BACT|nr:hypothetical protein [Aliarcobacter cibarius]TLT01344.1 hypothetical protein FE247_02350 [Aliarcobacter cibarius]TLT01749.1 hypothetical protein FE245_02350 [Aliarcobacter cibarius]
MKKLIAGTVLSTLLFTGCTEDETLKNAKIQFERDTVTLGYMKAKEVAEASHKEEIVQSWIEDLKTKNKWFTYEQVKNEMTQLNSTHGGIKLNLTVIKGQLYPKYGKDVVDKVLLELNKGYLIR